MIPYAGRRSTILRVTDFHLTEKTMIRKAFVAVLFLALGSMTALAAHIDGKWTAETQSPRGPQTLTFDFHAKGAILTGTVTSPRGDAEIKDGKVEGESLSFVTVMNFNGNEMRIVYKGKIEAGAIKFTRQAGDRPAQEFVASRVK
jgi:hypothetical protein